MNILGTDSNGNSHLYKVTPPADTYTDLLSGLGGKYDLYSISVSSGDIVTFDALRLSDGARVVGQFDAQGKMTIIDQKSDLNVKVLHAMN